MKSLFVPDDRNALLARLDALRPESVRQWGKMNPAQMLAHCSAALETPVGDRPEKQRLLGKILMPLFRKTIIGEKPFSKNSPTSPVLVISDERDFRSEKDRLTALIQRFVERGPEAVGRETHSFFGALTGEEWSWVMYKHIDHHLRQFSA